MRSSGSPKLVTELRFGDADFVGNNSRNIWDCCRSDNMKSTHGLVLTGGPCWCLQGTAGSALPTALGRLTLTELGSHQPSYAANTIAAVKVPLELKRCFRKPVQTVYIFICTT